MQTSSNFFNKSFFTLENDFSSPLKSNAERYSSDNHYSSIPDPLHSREQLTPWGQINPKYNIKTERLAKFRPKEIRKQRIEEIREYDESEKKSEMVSNLFNFYKNSAVAKDKKKIQKALKHQNKGSSEKSDHQFQSPSIENGWSLPLINEDENIEQQLIESNPQKQQNTKGKKGKNSSTPIIESISIREYLNKLKEKEKVVSATNKEEKGKINEKSLINILGEQFTSNRYMKKKPSTHSSLILSKDRSQVNMESIPQSLIKNKRYDAFNSPNASTNVKAKTKNPKINNSPLGNLERSFQMYKRAAEQEVDSHLKQQTQGSQGSSQRLLNERNFNTISHSAPKDKAYINILNDRNLFKNNAPLSVLFSKDRPSVISPDNVLPSSKKGTSVSSCSEKGPQSNGNVLKLPSVLRNRV